jgi:DNA (cytosine-5)-methyltransferase 1
LLSDDEGNTFQEWVNMLGGKSVNGLPILFPYDNSVPYHLYWQVLNSKKHGVPQNRERVFLVGIRDDEDNQFQFPKEEHLTKRLKDVLESEVDEKYFLSDDNIKNLLIYNERQEKEGRGFSAKFRDLEETESMDALKCGGGGKDDLIRIELCKYSFYTCGNFKYDLCDTCDDGDNYEYLQNNNTYGIRRLTPRECFRLQDFPDTFKFVVSDSQLYKQAGNSITVRVLEKILRNLKL